MNAYSDLVECEAVIISADFHFGKNRNYMIIDFELQGEHERLDVRNCFEDAEITLIAKHLDVGKVSLLHGRQLRLTGFIDGRLFYPVSASSEAKVIVPKSDDLLARLLYTQKLNRRAEEEITAT